MWRRSSQPLLAGATPGAVNCMRPRDIRSGKNATAHSLEVTNFSLCPYGHRQCTLEPPERVRCRYCRHILLVRFQPSEKSSIASGPLECKLLSEHLLASLPESNINAETPFQIHPRVHSRGFSQTRSRVQPEPYRKHIDTFPQALPAPFMAKMEPIRICRAPPQTARSTIEAGCNQMTQPTQLQVGELASGSRGILSIRRAPRTPERPGTVKATLHTLKHSAIAQHNLHMPLEPSECLLPDAKSVNEFSTISAPNPPNMLDSLNNTISRRRKSRGENQSDAGLPFQIHSQTERVRSKLNDNLLDSNSLNSVIWKSKSGSCSRGTLKETSTVTNLSDLMSYVSAPIQSENGGLAMQPANRSWNIQEGQTLPINKGSSSQSTHMLEPKHESNHSARPRLSSKSVTLIELSLSQNNNHDTSNNTSWLPQKSERNGSSGFSGLSIPVWSPSASVRTWADNIRSRSRSGSGNEGWPAGESVGVKAITFPDEWSDAPPFVRKRVSHLAALVALTECAEHGRLKTSATSTKNAKQS